MNVILKFLIFASAFLYLAAADADSEDDVHMIKLTNDNFDDEIKTNNYFIKFYAPWCGHCQKLAPIWSELAEKLNTKSGGKVKIGKVDCTLHNDLCSQHDVTGYPTLKFFKLGAEDSNKYRGGRDFSSLVTFIEEQLGESVFDDENSVDEPPKPVSALVELTEQTFAKHVSLGKHFVKFYAPWCGHCQKLAPVWDELARTFEHDTSVKIAKIDCTQYRPICTEFDVKGYPTLLWIEDGKKIEKYSGSRAHEDLKAYVDKIIGGKADQVEKSETDKENASVVLHLTKGDFDHAIQNGVTCVKFYAPWCGHCKRLAPTWEQLAQKFIGHNVVKIGKVDCTLENNKELCTEQEVNGFPTVFIYKNGEKVSEYNGNRSLDDLYNFVSKHVSLSDKAVDHEEL
uniref:Putative pretaporter n=1 Tax=Corethrella appendiculata TaxID=1370023 RepID=U5ER38_9DIPT